jgi:O-antigen ligase
MCFVLPPERRVQSRHTPSSFRSISSQVSQYVVFVLVTVIAMMIGAAIAEEKWLYCLAALFIAVLLLYPIQVTLGLFTFLMPFDSIASLGEGNHGRTLTWFLGAAAGMVSFATGFAGRRLKAPPGASIWWSSFILWCAVTGVWALKPEISWQRLPTALALLGVYIACGCVRFTNRELQTIIILTILGGCVAAIWTVYLYSQNEVADRTALKWAGRDTNENEFGMDLLLPISLAIGYFLWCRRWIYKFLVLLAIGTATLGLLVTMSRGAVVALSIMFLAYLYRLRLSSRILVPILLLVILLCFMPPVFFVRFQESGATGGAGRLYIWKAGMAAFRRYGLFGAGLNNFPVAYTHYAGEASHFKGYGRDAHNIYLAIGVETGLVGLLLFACAVGSQLRSVLHCKDRRGIYNLLLASECAWWGMLGVGIFGNILWAKPFWLSWILLGAASDEMKASMIIEH